MAIEEVVTAPRSPWQNAYVERIIGSIRRECLDHVIIFDERHLRRVLSADSCSSRPSKRNDAARRNGMMPPTITR
jgi:transposase InsO family protein